MSAVELQLPAWTPPPSHSEILNATDVSFAQIQRAYSPEMWRVTTAPPLFDVAGRQIQSDGPPLPASLKS